MLSLLFVLTVPDTPSARIGSAYATEIVRWNLTRPELMAHELLPERDPLKEAVAAADTLRVVEARLMKSLGRTRARAAGRLDDGASFSGSVLQKLEAVPRGGGTYDVRVWLHLVRDEHGLLQRKDVVCTTFARIDRGEIAELPYFAEPSACR